MTCACTTATAYQDSDVPPSISISASASIPDLTVIDDIVAKVRRGDGTVETWASTAFVTQTATEITANLVPPSGWSATLGEVIHVRLVAQIAGQPDRELDPGYDLEIVEW